MYLSPPAASRSAFGVWQGPPKALDEPKPASSIRITRMLGAPFGGRSWAIGGYFVSGSFASYVTKPVRGGSGIGRCVRASSSLFMRRSFPNGRARPGLDALVLADRGTRSRWRPGAEEHPPHLA